MEAIAIEGIVGGEAAAQLQLNNIGGRNELVPADSSERDAESPDEGNGACLNINYSRTASESKEDMYITNDNSRDLTIKEEIKEEIILEHIDEEASLSPAGKKT